MASSDETVKKTTQAPKEQPAPQAAAPKKVERFIYVGPTLLEGLKQFAVFKGGIPKKYEKRFEANAEFKSLFVDLNDYTKVQNDVDEPGTALNAAYRTVKEQGVL